MTARVRIKPELITVNRMRVEMLDLEDDELENTIRMKGWAWVLARKSWVYSGEPDFIYRQLREVIIAEEGVEFVPDDIQESVATVLAKARSDEEREEGRDLLRRAFQKTGQTEGLAFVDG